MHPPKKENYQNKDVEKALHPTKLLDEQIGEFGAASWGPVVRKDKEKKKHEQKELKGRMIAARRRRKNFLSDSGDWRRGRRGKHIFKTMSPWLAESTLLLGKPTRAGR